IRGGSFVEDPEPARCLRRAGVREGHGRSDLRIRGDREARDGWREKERNRPGVGAGARELGAQSVGGAGDQNAAIAEKRGGMTSVSPLEGRCGGERADRGIVELGALQRQSQVRAEAADDEHFSTTEQGGGVVAACRDEVSCGGPGSDSNRRVEEL